MDPVVHFEMPYIEQGRVANFYKEAFGWETQILGPDMGDYILVTTAKEDVKPGSPAGAINGGLFPTKPDWPAQYPSVVIGVPDIGVAMRKIRDAGGQVLGDPMEVTGTGMYVSFLDTEGNRNSILQPYMEA